MTCTRLKRPEIGQVEIPLHLDEGGILINTDVWRSETARKLAEVDGIGRPWSDHWADVNFLFEKFSYADLPNPGEEAKSYMM